MNPFGKLALKDPALVGRTEPQEFLQKQPEARPDSVDEAGYSEHPEALWFRVVRERGAE